MSPRLFPGRIAFDPTPDIISHGDPKAAQDKNCLHLRHPQLQRQASSRRRLDPCRRPHQQGKHLRGKLPIAFCRCLVQFAILAPLTSCFRAVANQLIATNVKLSRAVKWLEEADFEAKIVVAGKCCSFWV